MDRIGFKEIENVKVKIAIREIVQPISKNDWVACRVLAI